jgi:type IV fimbrial biogenesis protein FimT
MLRARGFTLVEMIISVAFLAFLLALALPDFGTWMRNLELRNAAQSITSGLQRARAEAVSRNTNVRFVLGAGTAWTVSVVTPAEVIETRSAVKESENVTFTVAPLGPPAATTITFNNFGVITPNADGTATLAQVNLSDAGGIGTRNFQISVGAGGNAKMCDTTLGAGTSPSACTCDPPLPYLTIPSACPPPP